MRLRRLPLGLVLRGALSIALPPRCLACATALARTGLCDDCVAALRPITAACRTCGKPLGPFATPQRTCANCRGRRLAFGRATGAVRYAGPGRDLVRNLKFRREYACAKLLADLLIERVRTTGFADGLDCVTPAPLSRRRRLTRGFNQAELLARSLSDALELPLRRLLARRERPPQSAMRRAMRLTGPHGAFRLARRASVKGLRILLVDDVLTTGATADAAARVLREAGAREVRVAAAAR